MRFSRKDNGLKVGSTRIKKWFAILPVCINQETRWLEFVKTEQRLCSIFGGFEDGNYLDWINTRFID